MKVEKFKVLIYLKKSGLDKSSKAPTMERITVNQSMAQFGTKLSCTPNLRNPRESQLDGKSREAVEVNAKINKLLLSILITQTSAYNSKYALPAHTMCLTIASKFVRRLTIERLQGLQYL